jgi:hypothetical protein
MTEVVVPRRVIDGLVSTHVLPTLVAFNGATFAFSELGIEHDCPGVMPFLRVSCQASEIGHTGILPLRGLRSSSWNIMFS